MSNRFVKEHAQQRDCLDRQHASSSDDPGAYADENHETDEAEINRLISESPGLAPSILFNPAIPETAEYCTQEAAQLVGLEAWQFRRAVRLGLIEDSESHYWPKWLLLEVFRSRDRIWSEVAEFRPRGAHKCATHLRKRSGLDASVTDVHELIERYKLRPVGSFKGSDIYDLNDIDDLIDDEPELLESIVSNRAAWEQSTVDIRDLAARNGITQAAIRWAARKYDVPYEAEWGIYQRIPIWAVDILVAEVAKADQSRARLA
jgi:hypothetical protein